MPTVLQNKLTGLKRLFRMFPLREIQRFRKFRRLNPPEPVDFEFCIRPLANRSVCCRAGTTDAKVLIDAFESQYHVPVGLKKEPSVIFDVGCNVGYTVAHYAVLYPEAQIIGIELDARNAEIAKHNTRLFGKRVQIVAGAVWVDDGTISYGGDQEWGFQVTTVHAPSNNGTIKTAPAYAMNTLFEKYAPQGVDYMKMDIEGAEAFVLQSRTEWLQKVGMLYLEVHGPATMEGCFQLLQNLGFDCRHHSRHPTGMIAVNRNRPC